jgi:hypothetical protein
VDQSGRLEDATACGDVVPDREDFFLRQVGAVQGCALSFGEAGAAGAAVEKPILAVLAQVAGDGEISGAAASTIGAVRIQATAAREIVPGASPELKGEARTRLETLRVF